jgi:hypothetical protein
MWAVALLATAEASTAVVPSCLERVMGIEPTSSAWKAEVLPLNYTRRLAKSVLRSSENYQQRVTSSSGAQKI